MTLHLIGLYQFTSNVADVVQRTTMTDVAKVLDKEIAANGGLLNYPGDAEVWELAKTYISHMVMEDVNEVCVNEPQELGNLGLEAVAAPPPQLYWRYRIMSAMMPAMREDLLGHLIAGGFHIWSHGGDWGKEFGVGGDHGQIICFL